MASLVKHLPRRQGDRDWIDHFLFIRNHDCFYKVTHHVGIGDSPSKFMDITGHSLPSERGDTYVARSAKSDRPEPAATWHETEIGKKTLAEDKRDFHGTIRIEPPRDTKRWSDNAITCRTASKFIAVSYPPVLVIANLRSMLAWQRGRSLQSLAIILTARLPTPRHSRLWSTFSSQELFARDLGNL